jgi:predicted AAA+ superfamily ATPase
LLGFGMKRDIWNRLEAWKNAEDRKPLILRGARQVGKTYILQEFCNANFRAVHYVNFERSETAATVFDGDLDPGRVLRDLSFLLDVRMDEDKDVLIFDEIQNAPRALTALKYFREERSKLAVCAAGSLLGVHLGESSFPVGQVEFLDLFPMSFEEFLRGIGDLRSFELLRGLKPGDSIPEVAHRHLWEQLKVYLVVGGLPEAVQTYAAHQEESFSAMRLVRKKQEDLVTTYLADIAKHAGKENAMHIDRVWRSVPAQLAREQDGSAPKFRFKGVLPGVSRYSRLAGPIDWLKAVGLIIKVHIINRGELPFSAYARENCFKIYMFDVGLLGALGNLPPKSILEYDYGSYKGYVAENLVAQEFVCSGVRDLFCWREGRAEVEFLRESGGEVLPVEVKSGWITRAKSLKSFAERYCPPYRTIISVRPLVTGPERSVHQLPLYLSHRFPLR